MAVECVEIAQQAPTGSNDQRWQWVFVTDPAKKLAIAELYRSSFYTLGADFKTGSREPATERIHWDEW